MKLTLSLNGIAHVIKNGTNPDGGAEVKNPQILLEALNAVHEKDQASLRGSITSLTNAPKINNSHYTLLLEALVNYGVKDREVITPDVINAILSKIGHEGLKASDFKDDAGNATIYATNIMLEKPELRPCLLYAIENLNLNIPDLTVKISNVENKSLMQLAMEKDAFDIVKALIKHRAHMIDEKTPEKAFNPADVHATNSVFQYIIGKNPLDLELVKELLVNYDVGYAIKPDDVNKILATFPDDFYYPDARNARYMEMLGLLSEKVNPLLELSTIKGESYTAFINQNFDISNKEHLVFLSKIHPVAPDIKESIKGVNKKLIAIDKKRKDVHTSFVKKRSDNETKIIEAVVEWLQAEQDKRGAFLDKVKELVSSADPEIQTSVNSAISKISYDSINSQNPIKYQDKIQKGILGLEVAGGVLLLLTILFTKCNGLMKGLFNASIVFRSAFPKINGLFNVISNNKVASLFLFAVGSALTIGYDLKITSQINAKDKENAKLFVKDFDKNIAEEFKARNIGGVK